MVFRYRIGITRPSNTTKRYFFLFVYLFIYLLGFIFSTQVFDIGRACLEELLGKGITNLSNGVKLVLMCVFLRVFLLTNELHLLIVIV